MGSTGLPPFTPTSYSYPIVLRIWNSVVSSFLDPFRAFYRNGTVNWSQVVFLITCFVSMAGCALLSSLLRRRSQASSEGRRFRRSLRKDYPKTAAGTVTSSDEEDYDSNGSLRHGTEPDKGASTQHREQTVEGSFGSFSCSSIDIVLTKQPLQPTPDY